MPLAASSPERGGMRRGRGPQLRVFLFHLDAAKSADPHSNSPPFRGREARAAWAENCCNVRVAAGCFLPSKGRNEEGSRAAIAGVLVSSGCDESADPHSNSPPFRGREARAAWAENCRRCMSGRSAGITMRPRQNSSSPIGARRFSGRRDQCRLVAHRRADERGESCLIARVPARRRRLRRPSRRTRRSGKFRGGFPRSSAWSLSSSA